MERVEVKFGLPSQVFTSALAGSNLGEEKAKRSRGNIFC